MIAANVLAKCLLIARKKPCQACVRGSCCKFPQEGLAGIVGHVQKTTARLGEARVPHDGGAGVVMGRRSAQDEALAARAHLVLAFTVLCVIDHGRPLAEEVCALHVRTSQAVRPFGLVQHLFQHGAAAGANFS